MRHRFAFTLIELLAVVGISAFLFSITGRLFYDGWTETCRIRKEAERGQVVLLIMERWQKTLHGTMPDQWRADGAGLTDGSRCRIRQDGNRLLFVRAATTNSIALPMGMICSFAVERNPSSRDTAVLTLAMKRSGRAGEDRVRLVACGGD